MQKLLVKLFIKNYTNKSDPKVRSAYGVLSGIVGIITNLFLCAFKIFAGIISSSVSILADGINNLSDAGSSIITMIGFKLSSAPPDEEHPFGHERIEYISGMIIAIIILIIGFSLFKTSIEKIINPVEVETSVIIYVILGVSILAKLWQGMFYRRMGKDIDSTALIASGQDSINDVISTAAVLAGIIFTVLTSVNIDGYIGILVSLFILKSGFDLVRDAAKPLIGETPSKEEVKEISEKIEEYPGVLGIHDLVFHSYGPNKKFITVHVEVDSSVDIMISHDLMDNIEQDFKKELNIDLVVHMDPVDIHDENTLKYKEMVREILHDYDEQLTFHDFRIVSGPTHTNIVFDVVIPVKYEKTPAVVKAELAQKIREKQDNLFAVIAVDQMYDRNN